MHKDNPADRAFERQDAAKQPYDDARETYSEKNAKLESQASADEHGPERSLSEDEKKALLEQSAQEDFKEIGRKRAEDLDASN